MTKYLFVQLNALTDCPESISWEAGSVKMASASVLTELHDNYKKKPMSDVTDSALCR